MRSRYLTWLLLLALTACATPPTLNTTPVSTLEPSPTPSLTPTLGPTRTPQPPPTLSVSSLCSAQPAPDPAGQTIAFTARGPNSIEVFTVQADGAQLQQLTDNFTDDAFPRWTPDGQQLLTLDQGNHQLYLSTPGGSARTPLLKEPPFEGITAAPLWSPDGKQLAFGARHASSANSAHFDFYIMGLEKGDLHSPTNDQNFFPLYPAAWSEDGGLVIYYESASLDSGGSYGHSYVTSSDGVRLQELDPHNTLEWEHAFGWQAQLHQVVTLAKSQGVDEQLYLVSPDGATHRPLTGAPGQKSFPALSPDGSQIAYAQQTGSSFSIQLVALDGSLPWTLTTASTPFSYLSWSPDGHRLAYLALRPGTNLVDLYVINLCTAAPQRLASDVLSDQGAPAWKP